MSLSGALSSAVSALNAQSSALAMIGDNLANANTVAYKTTTASFEDLVTASGGKAYSSGGVANIGTANISQQGLLAASQVDTNVAIQGNGFFVVTDSTGAGGNTSYTRNGAFAPDQNGFLENNGSFLEGYRTDANGNIIGTGLEPIQTEIAKSNGGPTTESQITANLPANATINNSTTTTPTDGSSFTSPMTVYDSLGEQHSLNITWTKTADNTWTAAVAPATASDGTVTSPTTTTTPPTTGVYTITFNSDGSLGTVSPSDATTGAVAPLGIKWNDGAADSSITLNFGTPNGGRDGLTQSTPQGTDPAVTNFKANSDGNQLGTLTGVSISQGGIVEASYSNGVSSAIYKLAVATFTNPNGLVAHTGGLYTATGDSGNPQLQTSGVGDAGTVFGGELESSTTDTTGQFSAMIEAQQSYSAASQVVTEVGKMFDTLIQSMR